MNVDKITKLGVICLLRRGKDSNIRKTICIDQDVSGESKTIRDVCKEAWTPEVIAAYEAHKEAAI